MRWRSLGLARRGALLDWYFASLSPLPLTARLVRRRWRRGALLDGEFASLPVPLAADIGLQAGPDEVAEGRTAGRGDGPQMAAPLHSRPNSGLAKRQWRSLGGADAEWGVRVSVPLAAEFGPQAETQTPHPVAQFFFEAPPQPPHQAQSRVQVS